jgi:hypothetical protein
MLLRSIGAVLKGNSAAVSCSRLIENTCRAQGVEAIIYSVDEVIDRVLIRSGPNDKVHFFNGVILSDTGEVICHPPKRLTRLEPTDARLDQLVGAVPKKRSHELIEAANGTVVSLYYYANRWQLATSRSVDASGMLSMGGDRLMGVFEALFEFKGFNWDDLELNHSYTFVLCHPAYHFVPLSELHFIVAWDRSKNAFSPAPEKLAATAQLRRDFDAASVRDLCGRAPTDLWKALVGDSDAAAGAWGTEPPMGFLLRSTRPATADYYVESRLMSFLRRNIYENYRTAMSDVVELEWRKLYMLLHIYIASRDDPELFNLVFTQGGTYGPELEALKPFLERVERAYEIFEERSGGNLDGPELGFQSIPEQFYTLAAAASVRHFKASGKSLFRAELAKPLFELTKLFARETNLLADEPAEVAS